MEIATQSPPAQSTLESFNPATGELVGSVATITPDQVQGVVDDVARIQPAWAELASMTAPATCAAPPTRCSTTIDEIAELLVAEQGKPRAEAYTMELLPTVDALHWCAKAGPKILADEKVRMTPGLHAEQERPLLLRADRRRRRHRALELPLVDPLRRGGDRADGRQRRRPQAGQPDAAAGRGDPPRLREGRAARGPGPRRPRRRRGRRRARQVQRRQGLLHRLGRGRPQGRRGLRRSG